MDRLSYSKVGSNTAGQAQGRAGRPEGSSLSCADQIRTSGSEQNRHDGLIRLLLQSSPLELSQLGQQLSSNQLPQAVRQELHNSMEEAKGYPSRSLYQMGGSSCSDRLLSLIQLEHSYAKPWSCHSQSTSCQPTKLLYPGRADSSYIPIESEHEYISVDLDPPKPVPPYDPQQARKVMSECERFVSFANPRIEQIEDDMDIWEDLVPKEGWSGQQLRLYSRMVKVLHLDRLARLAQEGMDNEPLLRRITVDKSARRARAVLSAHPTFWETKQVQWLHAVFAENLPKPYLSSWLDILQTLRSKIPALVERLISGYANINPESRMKQVCAEGLATLLKRSWDPAISSQSVRRLAPLLKLPGNPVILVAPPGPADPRVISRRMRLWNNQLGCLGKVIVINMPTPKGEAALRTTVNHHLFQMISATLGKVREIKQRNGERPLVLMGWGVGAAIAAHVAGVETINGLVCLGFPFSTLAGMRGRVGDSLLDLKAPVLFVVGERAVGCRTDHMEELRERLGGETGLVVVGGADSILRVSRRKKKAEFLTQSMVDRAIIAEVRDFLLNTLTGQLRQLPSTPSSSSPAVSTAGATFAMPSHDSFVSITGVPKSVRGRKRNSSSASMEGPPPSPAKRSQPTSAASAKSLPAGQPPAKRYRRPKRVKHPLADVSPAVPPPSPAAPSRGTPNFSALPLNPTNSISVPLGLLSISAPLPQAALMATRQISPPLLPIRVPSVLADSSNMDSAFVPPVLPSVTPLQLPTVPLPPPRGRVQFAAPSSPAMQRPTLPAVATTQRVIQYAPKQLGAGSRPTGHAPSARLENLAILGNTFPAPVAPALQEQTLAPVSVISPTPVSSRASSHTDSRGGAGQLSSSQLTSSSSLQILPMPNTRHPAASTTKALTFPSVIAPVPGSKLPTTPSTSSNTNVATTNSVQISTIATTTVASSKAISTSSSSAAISSSPLISFTSSGTAVNPSASLTSTAGPASSLGDVANSSASFSMAATVTQSFSMAATVTSSFSLAATVTPSFSMAATVTPNSAAASSSSATMLPTTSTLTLLPTTDRQDVAQILASLSGIIQDQPK